MPFENTVLVLGSFLAGFLLHILLMRQKKRKINPKTLLANIQYADQFLDSIKQFEIEKHNFNSTQSQINLHQETQNSYDLQTEVIEKGLEKNELEEEALSNALTTAGLINSRLTSLKPVIRSDSEQIQNIRIELEQINREYLRQRNNNLAELEFGKQRLKDIAYEKRKVEHEIKRLEESCEANQLFLDQFNDQLSRSEIDWICMEIDGSGILKKKFVDLLKLIIVEGDPVKIENDKVRIKKILYESLKKL